MNLRADIQIRAKDAGLTPNKLRGQHFLVDEKIKDRIIEAAKITSSDGVLEIGPGLGVLTDDLVARAKQVDVVDIDEQEVMFLRQRYADKKNISIHHADALTYSLIPKTYNLVSNLPYEITTPFLWRYLLELPTQLRPRKLVLLIQKEVADRLLIRKPPYNPLALLTQWFGEARRIGNVSRHAFWPEPRVEGGVVRITRSKNPKRDLAEGFEQDLFALIRCGFIHPRKKLVTNCAGRYGRKILLDIMQKNGLSAHIRAEECSLETWKQLTKSFRRNQDRGAPD